jgi:hypothetical protein
MSRKLLLRAWQARFGDLPPFVHSGSEAGDSADLNFREIAQPFSRQFCVSVQAMSIRLEKLGLLLRHEPQQQSLAGV